jgi:hypothetical protein
MRKGTPWGTSVIRPLSTADVEVTLVAAKVRTVSVCPSAVGFVGAGGDAAEAGGAVAAGNKLVISMSTASTPIMRLPAFFQLRFTEKMFISASLLQ